MALTVASERREVSSVGARRESSLWASARAGAAFFICAASEPAARPDEAPRPGGASAGGSATSPRPRFLLESARAVLVAVPVSASGRSAAGRAARGASAPSGAGGAAVGTVLSAAPFRPRFGKVAAGVFILLRGRGHSTRRGSARRAVGGDLGWACGTPRRQGCRAGDQWLGSSPRTSRGRDSLSGGKGAHRWSMLVSWSVLDAKARASESSTSSPGKSAL